MRAIERDAPVGKWRGTRFQLLAQDVGANRIGHSGQCPARAACIAGEFETVGKERALPGAGQDMSLAASIEPSAGMLHRPRARCSGADELVDMSYLPAMRPQVSRCATLRRVIFVPSCWDVGSRGVDETQDDDT